MNTLKWRVIVIVVGLTILAIGTVARSQSTEAKPEISNEQLIKQLQAQIEQLQVTIKTREAEIARLKELCLKAGVAPTYFNFFPDAKKDIAKQVKKWINTETKIHKELRITCKSVLLVKESRSKYTGVAEFSKGGNVGITVDVDKDGTMIFRLDQTDLIALYANAKLEFADIADYKLTSKYTLLGNGQQSENTSGFTIGDWVNQLKNRKVCTMKAKIDGASMLTISAATPFSTITIYCSIDHDTKTCITEGCKDGSGQVSTDSEETFQGMNQLYQLVQLQNDDDFTEINDDDFTEINDDDFTEINDDDFTEIGEHAKKYLEVAKTGTGLLQALAMFNLGVLYETGQEVKKDTNQAIYWYEESAKHGYKNAQEKLIKLGIVDPAKAEK